MMDSPGGLVRARVRDDGAGIGRHGRPEFRSTLAALLRRAARHYIYPLQVAGGEVEIGAVSIGNPHAVIRVASVDNAPVDGLGPAVENHSRFPNRTNVEFMEVVSPKQIRLRVHERGTGETLACGTGACGAVAVGRRHGLLGEEVEVNVRGGRLIVSWAGEGEHIWLTGPTETAYEGRVEV